MRKIIILIISLGLSPWTMADSQTLEIVGSQRLSQNEASLLSQGLGGDNMNELHIVCHADFGQVALKQKTSVEEHIQIYEISTRIECYKVISLAKIANNNCPLKITLNTNTKTLENHGLGCSIKQLFQNIERDKKDKQKLTH